MAKRPAKPVKPMKKVAKATKKASKPAPKAKPQKPAAKKAAGKPAPAPKVLAKPASKPAPAPRQAAILQPPPPPPLPVIRPPAADAVAILERGMQQLQRHDYTAAATTFGKLVADFPNEGFLADRARVYLELAQREVRRRPAASLPIEDRLTAATAALNNNQDAEAAELAEGVLKEDESQDLAAYLLAVVAARAERVEDAIARLRQAIELNPECRLQARQDEDFDVLREHADFQQLMEAPPAPAPGAAQKKPAKRGR